MVNEMLNLEEETSKEVLRKAIAVVPDFPKPGINFYDIMPIFSDYNLFSILIDCLEAECPKDEYGKPKFDLIVALEARAFLFVSALAQRLKCGFVPIRKRSKLPGKVYQVDYEKEYGMDIFEMQEKALQPNQKVILIDDILATGGTAKAALELLINKAKVEVVKTLFLGELEELNGKDQIIGPYSSLLKF